MAMRSDAWASAQPLPGRPRRVRLRPVSEAGARTQGERRRRDGLGLLPRARTPEERRRRALANQVGGLTLTVLGAFTVGGSAALLWPRLDAQALEFLLTLVLGALILAQGVWVLGRRDRRRSDRRR